MNKDDLIKVYCLEILKCCTLVRLNLPKKIKKKKISSAVEELMFERRATTLIPSLRLNDVEPFRNFHRMDPHTFDELLCLIGPNLKDQPVTCNEEITPSQRLSLTLRYLASGDSMETIGYYGFQIDASTTSNIIRETCILIWKKLKFVFPTPSEDNWHKVAQEFFCKWGFPNCLGAIDGRHVVALEFPNHNSYPFNYKYLLSLLLIAVADANYKFLIIDIGALGYNSDGAVFKTSKFGNTLLHKPNELHIPKTKTLPSCNEKAPFVFVADDAFPMRTNILRSYSERNVSLPPDEANFNMRISKARKVVENAFGLLASRFQIYRKPIIANKETVNNIVKATVCLHNWLLDKPLSGYLCEEAENILTADGNGSTESGCECFHEGLMPCRSTLSNHPSHDAVNVRKQFTKYFHQQTM